MTTWRNPKSFLGQLGLEADAQRAQKERNMPPSVLFTQQALDHLFTYHAPHGNQPERYQSIRAAARIFAEVIVLNTPVGADQSAAIRHVRDAMMTANAAVALEEVP
jgi:hypothetical protein